MKSVNHWLFLLIALSCAGSVLAGGCVGDPGTGEPQPGETGSPEPSTSPDPTPSDQPDPVGDNKMTVTVNGSLCGPSNTQYANEPCVQVTVCVPGGVPGTNDCRTIDNILLDTGSYGLRVFSSLVPLSLTQVASGKGGLAECVQFGDGSSEWGPVMTADVRLTSTGPASRVPIMLINSTYSTPPGPCSAAQSRQDTSPSQTGFNGILGVGLFDADCGSACATDAANGQYYSCTSTGCSGAKADPLTQQIKNPVAHLPRDNNGVIVELPAVGPSGVASLEGLVILGIGTQPDNEPGAVTPYGADSSASFATLFKPYNASVALTSFIDSGSSVLFFPPPADASVLPDCDSGNGGLHGTSYRGFYCPASTTSFSATNLSASGQTTGAVSFDVSNAFDLFSSGNRVFSTMADSSAIGASAVFDWGLPFFYGKDVYVGIEGKSSKLGNGSYWAY